MLGEGLSVTPLVITFSFVNLAAWYKVPCQWTIPIGNSCLCGALAWFSKDRGCTALVCEAEQEYIFFYV